MLIIDEKTRRFAANSIFPSAFYAALGSALGQIGAAQMHGFWSLHVFLGLPGFTLLGLALLRARLHWPAIRANLRSFNARDLGSYLLLLIAGACFGVLVSASSTLLVGMVVGLTYLLPWTRIPVCRAHFALSLVAILVGAVAWLFIHRLPVHSLYFMIVAWMLYIPPMFMHLLILLSLDRKYRIGEPYLGKSELDAHVLVPH